MDRSPQHDREPDPFQNPYHPFEEPGRYRAFQEGWNARQQDKGRTQNPYSFSECRPALAWLDGWTVADWSEREAGEGRVLGRHRGRDPLVSVS